MATLLLATIPANAFWSAALAMVGGYIDSRLFAPKATQEVGKMSDLQLQTASYGTPIPWILGTCRSTGNVIWSTKFVEHTKTQKQGGKGGGGGVKTTTYSYTISFAVGICQGPIDGLKNVWADGKLVNISKYQHTLYLGSAVQQPDSWIEAVEGAGNVPAFRGLAYIVFKDLPISDFGNRIPSFSFEVVNATPDVKSVVELVSQRAGLQSSDVDALDLQNLSLTGLASAGDQTGRAVIEQLQSVYFFDAIERNGKIVFKRRSGETGYEIAAEELGAYENSSDEEPYRIRHKDERELPRRLTVTYLSKDKDYQQGAMSAYRQITRSRQEQTIGVQLVLTDSEAKELAEKRLFEAWQNRRSVAVTLSNRFGWLVPGDLLILPIEKQKQNFMITKTTYGKPGLIKIEAVSIAQQVYATVGRNVDSENNPVPPSAPGMVAVRFLDLPLLPGEPSAERIFAACSADDSFYGVNLFRSQDNGNTWDFIGQITDTAVTGVARTVLPPGNTAIWDEASAVEVILFHGTLENRPAEDVLNYYNAALIGKEVVQFKHATLLAPNTYQLSGLLRGRLGTEDEIAGHEKNEPFILLRSLKEVPFSSNGWYRDALFRFGPSTLPITDASYQNAIVNMAGVGERPYSVCHVTADRDSVGTITLRWIRRTRINGDWKPYTDVPLGEVTETYDVEILRGNGSVCRTLTVNTAQAVYLAEQQIIDYGSVQAAVTVRIYQRSESFGRGTGKEEVV